MAVSVQVAGRWLRHVAVSVQVAGRSFIILISIFASVFVCGEVLQTYRRITACWSAAFLFRLLRYKDTGGRVFSGVNQAVLEAEGQSLSQRCTRCLLKDKLIQKFKFSHCAQMLNAGKYLKLGNLCSAQNISGASQQNSVAAFS